MSTYPKDEKQCPKCGFFWEGEDIYQHFLKMREEGHDYYKNKTDEEIRKTAGMYGWTEESPKCFSHIIGIELEYNHPQHYDGVSYWMCPKCETTWNRFTGKEEPIPPNPNRRKDE